MKLSFRYASRSFLVDVTSSAQSHRITVGTHTVHVQILHAQQGRLDLLIGDRRVTAWVSSSGTKRWVTVHGQTFVLNKQAASFQRAGSQSHAAGELTAPMPGQIRAVNVREGETVTKGQTLILLEAMKMELRIQAPMDGVVSSLPVEVGQTVEREQPLIVLEPHTLTT